MPSTAATHHTNGHNALMAGDYLTAQSEFAAALSVDRNNFAAMQGISIVLHQVGRHEAALEAARRATLLGPRDAGAWSNYGLFLGIAGELEKAEIALRLSLKLSRTSLAYYQMGLCCYSLGEFAEAVEMFDKALKLDPGNVDIIDQRGTALLGCGRYVEGLIDNKIRWGVLKSHPMMHSDIPEWNGEDLTGKSILVLHEQGYGDTFQFVRFVPRLRRMGAKRVVLSVREEAIDLIRVSDLADEVIGIRDEPAGGLASMDYKCPMLTVPAHMGLTISTIPSGPYLHAPLCAPQLPRDGRFKVGLVWAGKPMYAQDRWRSMPLLTLTPLVQNTKVSFYSLQQDERKAELWQTGMNAFITDLSRRLKNWSDTASLIAELDLLIAVDTAPAHLAAAMGKPVALMLPQASCWRWLEHSSTATPWYPSMKLFRQEKQGDWEPVIDGLKALLP